MTKFWSAIEIYLYAAHFFSSYFLTFNSFRNGFISSIA